MFRIKFNKKNEVIDIKELEKLQEELDRKNNYDILL